MLSTAYGSGTKDSARDFEIVKDDERPGRPCTSGIEENVEKISQIVRNS